MDPQRVERLHRCLVEALHSRGHSRQEPVTVAEISDELVPYARVRSELEVDLNADYEHILLQLLAESDRIRLEPEEARQALRRELDSPHPDVGIFRRFPSSRVWVEPPEERPVIGGDAPDAVAAPAEAQQSRDGDHDDLVVPESGQPCPHCGDPLPPGRRIRFCPHCGSDPRERACQRCGAATEPAWRFCVQCGAEADAR